MTTIRFALLFVLCCMLSGELFYESFIWFVIYETFWCFFMTILMVTAS